MRIWPPFYQTFPPGDDNGGILSELTLKYPLKVRLTDSGRPKMLQALHQGPSESIKISDAQIQFNKIDRALSRYSTRLLLTRRLPPIAHQRPKYECHVRLLHQRHNFDKEKKTKPDLPRHRGSSNVIFKTQGPCPLSISKPTINHLTGNPLSPLSSNASPQGGQNLASLSSPGKRQPGDDLGRSPKMLIQ